MGKSFDTLTEVTKLTQTPELKTPELKTPEQTWKDVETAVNQLPLDYRADVWDIVKLTIIHNSALRAKHSL